MLTDCGQDPAAQDSGLEKGPDLTVSAASQTVRGDSMLSILSDGPDWEMVLPDGHWCGWLQDGDCVSRNPRGHLTGHRLDDSAGCRDRGKCNGGFLLQACGARSESEPPSAGPGMQLSGRTLA